jgi:hypothetical protein
MEAKQALEQIKGLLFGEQEVVSQEEVVIELSSSYTYNIILFNLFIIQPLLYQGLLHSSAPHPDVTVINQQYQH